MGLLTAAGSRTTVHDEDRGYRIMQVFDFQLGIFAPGIDDNTRFSLEQLNDQLGTALMEKDPTMSQMHIFQSKIATGQAWRLG